MPPRKQYAVLDLRNDQYGVIAISHKPGVDYSLHLGGMTLQMADMLAKRMNEIDHKVEVEQPRPHLRD